MNIKKLFIMALMCLALPSFLQATINKYNNLNGSIEYSNTDNNTNVMYYPREERYSGQKWLNKVFIPLSDSEAERLFRRYQKEYQAQETKEE